MRPLRGVGAIAAALLLTAAPAASAKVLRAEGILPPGQSGFVSAAGLADGSGSPHLYDQQPLFIDFRRKPFGFDQPAAGATEEPRAGVMIKRDAFGVPDITAGTEDDAWFGAGYAVAEDRLFELELFKRATQGRLAEILGKDYLDDDLIARRDYYTGAELDAMGRALPPGLQARIDAYRDGINAWIAHVRTSPSDMPGEFAAVGATLNDWTTRDSLAVGVFLARTVPSGDGRELENLRGVQESGAKVLDKLLPLRVKGQISTIPRSEGLFPQGKALTAKQERSARKRSLAFAATLPKPSSGALASARAKASVAAGLPGRVGGSSMFAVREPGKRALLFNGPQLGFAVPELFVELEVHYPGLDARGVTAPGVPIIGIGHNANVAWGFTSGLSDDDDLYADKVVTGKPETYVFNGRERAMDCRDEVFDYRSPPSALLGLLGGKVPVVESGQKTERICRTVHGPVQAREGDIAYTRRYAIWKRDLETFVGIDMLNRAGSVRDVDAALRQVTWNENVIAADSQGNIGYWHPGLVQLRPKAWDQRLPLPGTGEAEWPGLVDRAKMPHVINPKQGWLSNWNNIPSQGWTTGDGEATERITGPYHRDAFLARLVSRLHRNPSFDGVRATVHREGTTSQARPLARLSLRGALKGASGHAKVVLETILGWDGDYAKTDANGTVAPGLAAWEAFKKAASDQVIAPLGPGAKRFGTTTSTSHVFDTQNTISYALRTLSRRGYRRAAATAYDALVKQFATEDPAHWREKRRMYDITIQGAASPPPLPFFDRGTWEQIVEVGP